MRHKGPPVLFFLGFGGSGYITIRKFTNIFKEITFIALNIKELNIKRKYEPKGNYVPIFYTLFQYLGWCPTEMGRKQPRKRQRTTHFSKAPSGFSSIQRKSQSLHYVYDALVDPPLQTQAPLLLSLTLQRTPTITHPFTLFIFIYSTHRSLKL